MKKRQTLLLILVVVLMVSWLSWRSHKQYRKNVERRRQWEAEQVIIQEQQRLGLTQEQITKLKAEVDEATAKLDANPSYPWLRAERAAALAKYGDYKRAMEEFRFAEQQEGGLRWGWLDLAEVLYEQEQDEMSLAVFNEVFSRDGGRHPLRGIAFAKLLFCSTNPSVRDPERAVKLVEQSMQIPAEREEDLYAYSESLAAAGRYKEAVTAIERVLAMVDSDFAERIKVLERLQDKDDEGDPKLRKRIERLKENQKIDESNRKYYQWRRALFLQGQAPPPKRY